MVKVVILSTADMQAAVWTNKQHLAQRLADHFEVAYVESLGLRTPTFSRSDVKRIMRRLAGIKQKGAESGSPVKIIRPWVLPIHTNRFVRRINAITLQAQFRKILKTMDDGFVLWSFSPITYGIERYAKSVVYHSVDLLHEIDGLPKALLLDAERHLIRRADLVVASSRMVKEHLEVSGAKSVELWENVADVRLYQQPSGAVRMKKAIFAGNMTPSKIDALLMLRLAEAGVPLVLAGPIGVDGTEPQGSFLELVEHPNVEYVGNLEPARLAHLMSSCCVGIIPYLQNGYTRGVFPMKVYEYLAAGLSVVSTPLPSLNEVNDPSIKIATESEFVACVSASLVIDKEAIAERRVRSNAFSWESRTRQAVSVIHTLERTNGNNPPVV
ncbi:glycosyltransferase [Crystallibacter crystallopoietes]|uniref:glycosyltransferase n=1 Tax=Crystallibacter crystallopoietes TaxID=37928 RepID=UPI0002A5090B|nr:glycosyltransferase [Arthrobacter crystallopoietes]